MRLRHSLVIQAMLALTLFCARGLSSTQKNEGGNGEWIFKLQREASHSLFQSHLGRLKLVKFFGPDQAFALIKGRADLIPLPEMVLYRQPNYRYTSLDQNPTDPDLAKCWALDNEAQTTPTGEVGLTGKDISAVAAWNLQSDSPTVTVALVDSGIMTTHEDLAGNLWTNPKEIPNNNIDDDANGFIDDVHGWNFVDGNNVVEDDHDHGTMCAGIIGAVANNGKGSRGVTGKVKLMAVKSLDENGMGTTANAVSAIQYAVNNGAQIINASWGGTTYNQALSDSIQWAAGKNVLFIAAAGNDGVNNDAGSSVATYPATYALPNVISVSAYDNRDQLASWSNYGKTTVSLGAPGVQIYSTSTTGYRYGDGTSFSAPYVSGAAALLLAYAPSLSAIQIKERLLMTSDVIDYYQKEKSVTAGRLNALHALENFRPERPQAPTSWAQQADAQSTAHPYANNTNESYTFTSPGATHIRVHFTKFETEACCDIVVAKDNLGRVVDTYSGELGDFTSADALGDTIILQFTSDATTTQYGFDIDYYEVSQMRDLWWDARRNLLNPWTTLLGLGVLLPEPALARRPQEVRSLRSPFQRLAPNLN